MIAETKIREKRMSEFQVSRRQFVASSAIMSTLATLGINPAAAWAEGDVLKIRMVEDIQVLDPGYMIGGAETTIHYADAAAPGGAASATPTGDLGLGSPRTMSRRSNRPTISTSPSPLKQGFMWSGDFGELTADDVKYSLRAHAEVRLNSRWPTLDHVDVTDKYSGVIVLKSPLRRRLPHRRRLGIGHRSCRRPRC